MRPDVVSQEPVPLAEAVPCGGCNDDAPTAAVTTGEPRGLGDTVASVIDVTGLGILADFYKKITGKECKCKTRQEALNELVPYGITHILK